MRDKLQTIDGTITLVAGKYYRVNFARPAGFAEGQH
jgi:hypothetical protein